PKRPSGRRLAADAEALDQGLVPRLVDLLDVVEKRATGRHHLQQATTGVVVLLVALEVFGEVGDALGEDGDLHFRRAGVVGLGRVFLNQSGFALSSNRHRTVLSKEDVWAARARDVVQTEP